MRVLQDCYASIKVVLADGGYRGDIIETIKNKFGYLLQVVMRDKEDKITSNLLVKDGLWKECLTGLITTDGFAATMNCSWNHRKKWSNYPL